MRDFILSDITGGNKAPFSKRSLEHLNEMSSELGAAIFQGLTNEDNYSSNVIIIQGCEITGTLPVVPGTYSYTNGIIYYQGDIYYVDANALLTIAVGQTAVWEIVDTTITGDPATFSDANTYDFHRIRKMRLVSATAGSGLSNYDDVKIYKKFYNNNSIFSTVQNALNVTGITVNYIGAVKVGKNVRIYTQLTLTSSAVDEVSVLAYFSSANYYPENNSTKFGGQLVYSNGIGSCGNVSSIFGATTKGVSGYVIADSINQALRINAQLPNGTTATSWQIVAFADYEADTPFHDFTNS